MSKKFCSGCKKRKPLIDFAKNKSKKDGKQNYCKACCKIVKRHQYQKHKKTFLKQTQKARLRNRQFVFDYLKTHSCVDCPELDPVVLTFDHVRGKKRFNLAKAKSQGFAIETLMKEIAKCDVRCCNCHARKTAKQFKWYRGLK